MTNFKQISPNTLLMNPNAGTVQSLEDWQADYRSDEDAQAQCLSFEDWAGDLCEVVWSVYQCWARAD